MKNENFDMLLRRALAEQAEKIEPSADLLERVKREANAKKREERGFMKMRKFVAAAAVVCLMGVTCYGAGLFGGVSVGTSNDITDFAKLEKAEDKLGFDAKYVESFANGFVFENGGTGKTQGQDEDGNPMGEKYGTMTVSYKNAKGDSVLLSIDGGNPYADAGVETTEGYSADLFKFVPSDYEKTAEDIQKEAAGELYISYGSEKVELVEMESYFWEDGGLYYCLTASDCGLGEAELAAMAAEIMK